MAKPKKSFAQKYRENEFKLALSLRESVKRLERNLPQLVQAIEHQDAGFLRADPIVAKLPGMINDLVAAYNAIRQESGAIGAATGHLLEEQESLRETEYLAAHQATKSQWWEIAPIGSVEFWVEGLELVELPIWKDAIEKAKKARPELWE